MTSNSKTTSKGKGNSSQGTRRNGVDETLLLRGIIQAMVAPGGVITIDYQRLAAVMPGVRVRTLHTQVSRIARSMGLKIKGNGRSKVYKRKKAAEDTEDEEDDGEADDAPEEDVKRPRLDKDDNDDDNGNDGNGTAGIGAAAVAVDA